MVKTKKKIKDKLKTIVINTLIVLLLSIFTLPYYVNAKEDEEEEIRRGAVPAAAGIVLDGITTVTAANASSSSTGTVATNYPESGDGYNSLTEINGTKFKNYKQYLGSYANSAYWSGTMADAGCGPTSIAIIASGYGIDKSPLDIANTMSQTSLSELSSALTKIGLDNEPRSGDSIETKTSKIKENLQKGLPVLVGINGGTGYSPGGHWMAALGMQGDDIVISNPGQGDEAVTENLEEFVTRCMQGTWYLLIKTSLPKTSSSSSSSGNVVSESSVATDGYTGIYKSGTTGRQFKEYKQNGGAPWEGVGYANGNTIGAWGCPITADAILCTGYGSDVTPEDLNSKYYGSYIVASGIAEITGCSRATKSFTVSEGISHLKNGGTLIVHTYNSKFTDSEHWMAIIDVSSDGKQVYLSNPNIYRPNGWMDAEETLGVMAEAIFIPADGGSGSYGNSSGITSLDNFLFIGDSRTVGMESKIKDEGKNITVAGVSSSAPSHWKNVKTAGETYTIASQISSASRTFKFPSKDSVKGISIALGVNALGETEDMKTVLENLLNMYPDTPIFVNSVFYVGSNYTYANNVTFNKNIDSFNDTMKDYCNTNSNFYYIDITSGLYENGMLSSKYQDSEGLHLNSEGNDILVKNIKEAILGSGANNENSSYSIDNLTSNIAQYIKPNGRGGYKIDINLDEKVNEMLLLLEENDIDDVDNYLKTSKKREYLKQMLKAELVTQFPDLRSANEIEKTASSDESLKEIKENLPGVIEKLEIIHTSEIAENKISVSYSEYSTKEELNSAISSKLNELKSQNVSYKNEGNNVYSYTQDGKKYKIEKTSDTTYEIYKITEVQNSEEMEEYVFNSLKTKNIQTKIENIITTGNITRNSVHTTFYTTINSKASASGYDSDTMESLYFSYIQKIRNNLVEDNTTISDFFSNLFITSTPEDELQGVIKIKRKAIDIDTKAEKDSYYLSYIPYDEFKEKCNNKDKTAYNYFTINSSGGIIVAQGKKDITFPSIIESSNDTVDLSNIYEQYMVDFSAEEQITASTPLSYLSQIYQHTMPVDMLWSLLVYGGDYNFIYDLTNLIFDTDITITAFDKVTETREVHTNTYEIDSKSKDSAITDHGTSDTEHSNGTTTITVQYITYNTSSTTELKVTYINSWVAKYINNTEKLSDPKTDESEQQTDNQSDITDWEQIDTTQLSDDEAFKLILRKNIKQYVTNYKDSNIDSWYLARARTAILFDDNLIDAYIDYLKGKRIVVFPSDKLKGITRDTTYTVQRLKTDLGFNSYIESDAKRLRDKIESVAENNADTKDSQEKLRNAIEDVLIGIYPNGDWDPQVSGGITTDYLKIDGSQSEIETKTTTYEYTTSSGQVTEKTDPNADEDNFITLLNKNGKAKGSLRSIAEWFFESVEKNSVLCDKLDLMKYLFGIAFGRDYDVDESFSFDIFDPENYKTTSSLSDYAGGDIKEKMWYALRKAGYSEIQAAAVMGNIEVESAGTWDTGIEEYGNSIGFGLIQWSFGRRTGLENYAASKGKSPSDEDIQIEYLLGEMTPGGGCDGYASYQFMDGFGYTISDWENATSIEEATHAFCWTFERPAVEGDRVTPAKKYYEMYNGIDLSTFEKSSSSSSTSKNYASKLSGKAKQIVEKAESKLGCDYVYGGSGPDEFDCSGLVYWCYNQAGITIPRTVVDQKSSADNKNKTYDIKDAKPGDILWNSGHVGICVSNEGGKIEYIHAPEAGDVVKYSTNNQFSKALRLWE